jgi:tRNA(fMet)-specific endonuclease VapC
MSLFVLDTDHVTLLGYGHSQVVARLQAIPVANRAITIITVEEQLRAWFTQVRKARDADRLARAYEGLLQVIDMAKTVRVLPFSPRIGRSLPTTEEDSSPSWQTRSRHRSRGVRT